MKIAEAGAKALRLAVPLVTGLVFLAVLGLIIAWMSGVFTEKIDALEGDKTVTAVVDERVPQAEAASRSFLVKLRLPRREDLYEGMFGRVMIPAGERRHVCLHTGAVESVGQLEYVDVVMPDGTVERRLIKTRRW